MDHLTSGQIRILLKPADQQSKVGSLTITQPKEFHIVSKLNDHTRLVFKKTIGFDKDNDGDDRLRYIELMQDQTLVTVELTGLMGSSQAAGKNQLIFAGIVTDFNIKFEETNLKTKDRTGKIKTTTQEEYCLEIQAVSYTYQLDQKERKRTWQNQNMLLKTFLEQICKRYSSKSLIFKIVPDKIGNEKLGRFYLQYEETDWKWLTRIASNHNLNILPDPTVEKPRFYFGIPIKDNKDLDRQIGSINNHIASNLANYRYSSTEVSYKILKTSRDFDIGNQVEINGKKWIICQKVLELEKNLLVYKHIFTTEAGLKRPKLTNSNIAGIALRGKVLKVKGDRIKVHFDIDGECSEEKDCFFPYATAYAADGQTGLYCMPEENDSVQVYFPSSNESEGVVMASIRKTATSLCDDSQVKCFRTKNAKELKFDATGILFTEQNNQSGKVLIWLNEGKGIVFYGQKTVRLKSKLMTKLAAPNINVVAGKELTVSCPGSKLTLDGNLRFQDKQILKK